MLTVDEQLEQALAKVCTLEKDVAASADLLSDAEGKIRTLTTELADFQAKHKQLKTDFETQAASIETLASQRLADLIAATGTKEPAPVTPIGDKCSEDLVSRFAAITDPKEQTLFWRSLAPAQKAQILTATAN